jgi:hypothetical protein
MGKELFKRIFSGISMMLLLIGMLTLAFNIQVVRAQGTVQAQNSMQLPYPGYPLVGVYPYNITCTVNETFTISVIAYNLTNVQVPDPYNPLTMIPLGNLYGFDVQFTWDPTIIHCVSHTVTAPFESYSTPIPPSPYAGILHGYGTGNTSLWTVRDVVNESGIADAIAPDVRAWFSYVTLFRASVFNGNGTICTMTFKALKKGQSPVQIAYAMLSDVHSFAIGFSLNMLHQGWLNPPRSGMVTTEDLIPRGPGDVNGDGGVDILDVVLAATSYGSIQGSPNWNPAADLVSPYGKIDILDLVTITCHYGQKYS